MLIIVLLYTGGLISLPGGGIRRALPLLSRWKHPGLRELLRLRPLLRLQQCSAAARPPCTRGGLPVCLPASRAAGDRSHLRLGRWDQGVALKDWVVCVITPPRTECAGFMAARVAAVFFLLHTYLVTINMLIQHLFRYSAKLFLNAAKLFYLLELVLPLGEVSVQPWIR